MGPSRRSNSNHPHGATKTTPDIYTQHQPAVHLKKICRQNCTTSEIATQTPNNHQLTLKPSKAHFDVAWCILTHLCPTRPCTVPSSLLAAEAPKKNIHLCWPRRCCRLSISTDYAQQIHECTYMSNLLRLKSLKMNANACTRPGSKYLCNNSKRKGLIPLL